MAGHHHHHHHPTREGDGGAGMGRALLIGIVLNVVFVVIELSAGFIARSTALVADAVHNFGDVLGLVLAAIAARLATRKPSARRTYGLRRSTILASLANAVLLLVSVGAVSWEAIERLRAPAQEIRGGVVVVLAAIGVLVNAGSALLLSRGRKRDANVRGAYLHLVADAAVSLGVVIAGALMIFTGASWLDPVASLIVSVVILVGTWSLLRESVNLALDAVPEGIDPDQVRSYLGKLAGVIDVHDLHIWAMSTTETALTAHLVMPGNSCHPAFLRDVGRELEEKFSIAHTTLQVEAPDAPDTCMHAPDDVV